MTDAQGAGLHDAPTAGEVPLGVLVRSSLPGNQVLDTRRGADNNHVSDATMLQLDWLPQLDP
jgi:hypothetical protein